MVRKSFYVCHLLRDCGRNKTIGVLVASVTEHFPAKKVFDFISKNEETRFQVNDLAGKLKKEWFHLDQTPNAISDVVQITKEDFESLKENFNIVID